MSRIEIRDSGNPSRVLGTIPMMTRPVDGVFRLVTYAPSVYNPLRATDFVPFGPVVETRTVLFHVHEEHEEGGWVTRRSLKTGAPLEDLSRIEGFRYQGETEEAARLRARCAYYR